MLDYTEFFIKDLESELEYEYEVKVNDKETKKGLFDFSDTLYLSITII